MHATVEDAQRHQLGLLLDLESMVAGASAVAAVSIEGVSVKDVIIERILEKREGVIAILCVKTRKPRAKKNATPAPRTRRTNVPSPGTEAATQQ